MAARFHYSKSVIYLFLAWNLLLALVPLVASTLLTQLSTPKWANILLFVIWLLFFPNAPYLLTDLIHLHSKPPVPVWFDLGLLLSCVGTGLFIGYLSLLDIHAWLTARLGRGWGWTISISVLFLGALGIYLGRFLRWNSWDLFVAPSRLLSESVLILGNPAELVRIAGVTLVFGTLLTLGYLVVQTFVAEGRSDK